MNEQGEILLLEDNPKGVEPILAKRMSFQAFVVAIREIGPFWDVLRQPPNTAGCNR